METLSRVFNSHLESNYNSFKNQKICFIKKEKEEVYVSYEQLYYRALGILGYLQYTGIKPGNELVILQEDNENFVDIFWACILGGIIPVPISISGSTEHKWKLINIWRLLNKPHLITNAAIMGSFEDFMDKKDGTDSIIKNIRDNTIMLSDISLTTTGNIYAAKPDDIALIQFSSGSTGDPKGVVLTHTNLITNIKAICKCAKITTSDIGLSWLPLTHDMGLVGFHLIPFYFALSQINMPTALFIRRPLLWMDKATQHNATVLSSPNFGYKYFLSFLKPEHCHNWELSKVRLIFNGAEPISSKLCTEFLTTMGKYGLKKNVMYPVYGMAEASLAVTFPPPGEQLTCLDLNRNYLGIGDNIKVGEEAPGCSFVDLGFPVEDCEVRILDDDSNILEEGYIGYIQIKGKNVTGGYYNNPIANAKLISQDGWLNTGDLGFMKNGRLYVTGREKDVIFVNGQNYYLHDIERVVQEAEDVGEAVACGIINEEYKKDDVLIFVLFKKDIDKFVPVIDTVKNHMVKQMGIEIKEVIPIKKIPKTTSGKVMRYKLKEMYCNGKYSDEIQEMDKLMKDRYSSGCEEKLNILEKELLGLWAKITGNNNISVNDNFLEIGGTSLLIAKFCSEIEKEKIGKVSIIDLFTYPSIKKLAEYLSNADDCGLKEIEFLQIKLPDDYFVDDRLENNSTYLFDFKGSNYKRLEQISKKLEIGLEKLLVTLLGYQLYRISKQQFITIQTVLKAKNIVEMLSINFNKSVEWDTIDILNDFDTFIDNQYSYCVNNVDNLAIRKENNYIAPLFYKEEMLQTSQDILSIYDISLGITQKKHSVSFTFEANERLNSLKVRELIHSYIKLLYLFSETFEMRKEMIE